MSLATNVATIHQNKMADSEMESTDAEHPPSETSGNAADSEATPEPHKLDEEMHDNKINEAQEGESNVRVEETLVLQAPIEEEPPISDYDYENMKSSPEVVKMPPSTLLELSHSFGYECHKRSNLLVLSKDVLLFAAGNYVQLFNISTKQQTYLRTLGGGGVGAISVHPSHTLFAVGEKGSHPVIAIYTSSELKLHRLLREGTEESYSHMDFSPGDGSLLASVGGSPDFMLTVWDWKREKVLLRSKAFSQDIYRVTFSPVIPGQLTTSGTGHIRFWKMANTFTGLKLQGQLGKFGRTELSDISAYVELPDGKVLSGTEWGNFLLWDGGFIKVEISKKGKKLCHNGTVEALYLVEGELISAGIDGFVRVWDFETIDNADITEASTVFEMDPLVEIKVGTDVALKSLSQSIDPDLPTVWYAQDAGGAIWKTDLVVSHTRRAPEKVMGYHSGPITGISCSPAGFTAASISLNGSVRVYNLHSRELLCHTKYPSGGCSLLWVPLTMDQQGTTILSGHEDGILRIMKLEETPQHLQRQKDKQTHQLTLTHACKPHNKGITAIAVHPEGKVLATGSKDCTVFFLGTGQGYPPIGFIKTPAPVTILRWRKTSLLICCEDGSMLESQMPIAQHDDAAKSFLLDQLPITIRQLTSIKDKLRTAEEEARKAAVREKRRKEREAAKKLKKEQMGENYVSEDEEEEEEEEGEGESKGESNVGKEKIAEESSKGEVSGPSSILAVIPEQNSDRFWVSMGGNDAGYMYQCTMEGASSSSEKYEPPFAIAIPNFAGRDLPLHSMTFSSSGEYLLTGASNGYVRIHPLSKAFAVTSLESYWALSVHDNTYGAVTQLAVTYDDQFVVTGGADGNIFVFKANLLTASQQQLKQPEPPIVATKPKAAVVPATDIEDATSYSIEDAKQKTEHDQMMKRAEEKKQHVRRMVASLRNIFQSLLQESAKLPKPLQLDRKEFVMDPDMEKQLLQQRDQRVKLVHSDMAWESEKHTIGYEKLQKWFKDVVQCERIIVWAIQSNHFVESFRAPTPSQEYLELVDKVLSNEKVDTPWTVGGRRPGRDPSYHGVEAKAEGGVGGGQEGGPHGLSKKEARRLRREQRKKEWEELFRSKPDEKLEDPGDLAALQSARQEIGDYKLKSSNDYVVPEHQRVSTDRKRIQLVMLRKKIFEGRLSYNTKLVALRDQKLDIVNKLSALVHEIAGVQAQLPPEMHKPLPTIPVIKPEEVPERELQPSKETLHKFKEEMLSREAADKQKAAGVGDGFGGFGGFGDSGGGGGQQSEASTDGRTTDKQVPATKETGVSHSVGGESEDHMTTPMHHMTSLELQRAEEQRIRLQYRRDCLLKEAEEMVSRFDEAVMRLRHERALLATSIVSADLRHITQFEELQLLKEFEKREMGLTSRYSSKKKEKQEMEEKIDEAEHTLEEKDAQLAKLQEQEKALEASFVEAVGENKFKDFLLKVYRKKIKRSKKKVEESVQHEENEEGESDDSDSDSLSSSEEGSEEEEVLDDSTCPIGCDPSLFNRACELREKRLDLEDAITEEKKTVENMRKELDAVRKKVKTMESHVKTALGELQAFQLMKQQRLNELDQVAILRLHQVLYFASRGEPHKSIAPCLVFPASVRQRLMQRIKELEVERQQEKTKLEELHLKHVSLTRKKKKKDQAVTDYTAKVNEMTVLKFGRLVDLEQLEGLTANHIAEELRTKLRALEQKAAAELASKEAQIQKERIKLANLTRENTQKLNSMAELLEAQRSLEDTLNHRQKTMASEAIGSNGGQHMDPDERSRLQQLIELQASELAALKEEIKSLSVKGGFLLPPMQPPGPDTPVA